MAEKRYYWIQLKEGFFKQKEIKKLRKIAGGDTYTVIYLKMLLAAVKQGNKLFFEGVEDTFPEELALELDEDPENVKVTLSFLERQGLIRVMGEDEFLLLQCDEMVGSESESAARVRRYREKKATQSHTHILSVSANAISSAWAGLIFLFAAEPAAALFVAVFPDTSAIQLPG